MTAALRSGAGRAKLVYSRAGDALTFRLTGTDAGLMCCAVEEYADGEPVGRLNFYDIPLCPVFAVLQA